MSKPFFVTHDFNFFFTLQYDPKSRPVFTEIIKKLCILFEKINGDDCVHQNLLPTCDRKCNHTAVSHTGCNCKMPIPPAYNHNNTIATTTLSKRNSIDANFMISPPKHSGDGSEIKQRQPREPSMNSLSVLQHRRSLSENVLPFPLHATPSDKARCHLINRQLSGRIITEASTEHPINLQICPNMTLRKVAETMFLKDPHYKPRMGEQATPKSNPFTALAQLKGVKKILGANPTTYTAGAGDLFSSCFEMSSSPFVKDAAIFQSIHKNGVQSEGIPKSLPSSPKAMQKNYAKIDKSILKTAKNGESAFLKKDLGPSHDTKSVSKEPTHSNGLELDLLKSTGTIKKYKANSLYSHPLFKCNDDHAANDRTDMFDNPKILTRRGSSESGFFSCLNDDDFTAPKPSTFNLDRHSDFLSPICRCCHDGLQLSNSNDTSSGLLMMDDRSSTTLSSLRSLDDLDLFEKPRQFDTCRHPNMLHQNDNDTLSIDMGLINRLSLDSEINSIIQKNQFANQLLYCKNRTSSIYTDSSDDISSLAGSDSLLWDDRISSYTTSIPNARSAQIAKIVEYFERKGQSFTPSFNVPDSFKSTPTTSERRDMSSISTDCFPSRSSDYCRQHGGMISVTDRKFLDFKTAKEYETFCMELERRPNQQRLTVCDGVVKSKLQIFDKLNNKRGA